MCKAVLWRLTANGLPLVVPLLATAIGLTSIVHAESVEPVAPSSVLSPQSCQEQFLLGRKENAQLALQRLRQCNAIYNISMNIEEFTFWYVTLPSKSASQHNAWFGNTWRNTLQILTAAPVSVAKQDAIGVLDAGIGRGLKRAKREDLAPKWLASHDPAIMAEAASTGAPAPTQQEHAQAGQVASDKLVAPSPQIHLATRPATYHPTSRPRRVARGVQTRHPGAGSFRPDWYELPQNDPLIDELNRAQLQGPAQYAAVAASYSAPRPQPYMAPSGRPASSFASAAVQQPAHPSGVQQQPASAASSAQQPAYAFAQLQASYAASSQPGAYLPLPLQIEANVRSILQQFATNVNTLERAISRQFRGY
jgi:hypothetical protein